MKSSTSWPSWSRKYSATVNPVRATRARAPGGSFICPYTSATLEVLSFRLMTPPSIISWYRSLPSLVLSPTPANTEYPPWALATLLMSSMMSTVLPTPAPPNRPILPPFTYGARRSTTLIPVTRISCSTLMSSKTGASACIAALRSVSTGPLSSIGSPITLMIRPSVSGPTGIMMGDPVLTTTCPLTSPSVPSMAMVRTVFSPRCCATSKINFGEWSLTTRPLRISERPPSSNWTSTTAPITDTTAPVLAGSVFAAAEYFLWRETVDGRTFFWNVGNRVLTNPRTGRDMLDIFTPSVKNGDSNIPKEC